MKYKGIIFDLDGVICHTDQYHYQAWKKLADKWKIPFDEKINDRLRGVSRMESVEIILEKYNGIMTEEQKQEFAEEKNKIYVQKLEKLTPEDVSEDVINTLKKLKELGYKAAIGSSSKNTKFILEKIGLLKAFDAISDGTNISRSKPDPEVFLKASEYLGLSSEECLVVEDAEAGIDAAVNGGFDSAGVGDAAKYNKTTYPLKNFCELLEIV